MPCKDALISKVKTLSPDQTVDKAVAALKKAGVDSAPVVNDDGAFVGIFSLTHLLEDLLPVSVNVDNKPLGNVRIPAAPGMGTRLQKKQTVTIDKIMKSGAETVAPDDSVEAAVNKMSQTGHPIAVVDKDKTFMGVVTAQSLLAFLSESTT